MREDEIGANTGGIHVGDEVCGQGREDTRSLHSASLGMTDYRLISKGTGFGQGWE